MELFFIGLSIGLITGAILIYFVIFSKLNELIEKMISEAIWDYEENNNNNNSNNNIYDNER